MVLDFKKNFYNLKAIKRTVRAYRGLANFRIEEDKNKIKVRIRNINKDVKKIIGDEFCNYVLAKMKK